MCFTCIQILAKRIHSLSQYTPIYEQLYSMLYMVMEDFFKLKSCFSTEARVTEAKVIVLIIKDFHDTPSAIFAFAPSVIFAQIQYGNHEWNPVFHN